MKSNRPLCILCWITGVSLAVTATFSINVAAGEETLPKGLNVVGIEVSPSSIELTNRFQYRQVLVTGKLDNGQFADLTRMAKLAASSNVVKVSDHRVVRPAANGSGQLVFKYGEHSANLAVKVSGYDDPYEVSFIRDVQPAFSRMGCNAGTCHGSANGKEGFKLSLRGYDAIFDYRAFTDDIGARRFNRAAPDQSLMLLKASGSIPHVGGMRTEVDSPYYELVRQWIADGVRFDGETAARVTKIEVAPRNPIVPMPGMRQQIVVQATYSDGSVRDVTQEAFIESGNIEVIEAEPSGVLKMLRRGEAAVLVRYEGAYAATTLTVMGQRTGFAWNNPPTYNYVDELVYKKLQRVKILPSDVCSDTEFVRRVYIDLTGLPPSAGQIRSFLSDKRDSRTKRESLVDELIGGREFVEHWTNKWADLLQVNRKFLGETGSVALRNWIKNSIATNKPYDQFAREVITASGSTLENPPAAYWKVLRDPTIAMENTTHLFLAVRFNCNKCHDHPFERWTQDQYYNLAQYFAAVGRKEAAEFKGQQVPGSRSAVAAAKPLVEVIFDSGSGSVKHDRTGQIVPPKFPYDHDDVGAKAATRRQQLAHWMTSRKNEYFASSYVNRLWGYLLGVGIIQPIDDIRAGNPPTNPELLDTLTKDFVESGFDTQHVLRTICKSRVYQHSFRANEWNEDDEINYSHAVPRRLPAEVLYDAIHAATGSQQKFPGLPPGLRAAQLPDVGIKNPFLDDFGRPVRESSCECERSSGMVLGPVMKLINGPTVANAIGDPNNVLTKLAAEVKDDRKLIEEVFLRFLGQFPSDEQMNLALTALQSPGQDLDKNVAALKEYEQKRLPEKQAVWEANLGRAVNWMTLDVTEVKSQIGATFERRDDKSVIVKGKLGKDTYTIAAQAGIKGITAIRLEALNDKALPAGGPGRAKNGNFVLNELRLTASAKSDAGKSESVKLQNASADFSQQSWHVRGAIDGNEATGWAVSPQFNKTHTATFETTSDVGFDGGTVLTFTLSQQFGQGDHSLGRIRLSVTNAARPIGGVKLPEDLAKAIAVPKDKRTPAQIAVVSKHYLATDSDYAALKNAVEQSRQEVQNRRLIGIQDLAWALINNPAFLFNR